MKIEKGTSERTNHILGQLVDVVRHHVELKLDGLVLLVLVASFLRIEDAQPEVNTFVRAGHCLVSGHHFHLQSRFFGEEFVIQQVFDARPVCVY